MQPQFLSSFLSCIYANKFGSKRFRIGNFTKRLQERRTYCEKSKKQKISSFLYFRFKVLAHCQPLCIAYCQPLCIAHCQPLCIAHCQPSLHSILFCVLPSPSYSTVQCQHTVQLVSSLQYTITSYTLYTLTYQYIFRQILKFISPHIYYCIFQFIFQYILSSFYSTFYVILNHILSSFWRELAPNFLPAKWPCHLEIN